MLDFPTPTSIGQVYAGTNGVTYIWTGTLWLASGASAGGDFYATHTGALTIPSAASKITPTTVVSGNAGGWYSAGRYTPPAGRYRIHVGFSALDTVAASVIGLQLRQNGTQIAQSTDTTAAANFTASLAIDVTVDANGTDYWEMWGTGNTSTSASANSISFLAFPISGIKGPPGDPTPGTLIQTVSYQTGALATGTTVIPFDDTIPQIGEGNEYMTLAITPRSATSKLVIDVLFNGSHTVIASLALALFQDSTTNALAVTSMTAVVAGMRVNMSLRHTMVSGTTSATTFRVRAGAHTAGTLTFNGANSLREFGSVMASSIVIQEVAP